MSYTGSARNPSYNHSMGGPGGWLTLSQIRLREAKEAGSKAAKKKTILITREQAKALIDEARKDKPT